MASNQYIQFPIHFGIISFLILSSLKIHMSFSYIFEGKL